MALQSSRLVMVGLPSVGDVPVGMAEPLVDGVHLRWAFQRDLGFPWFGFYLFRRPSRRRKEERQCVRPGLRGLHTGPTGSTVLHTPLGRFRSDTELRLTDDFPPQGIAEVDLAGRRYLRFDIEPSSTSRRVYVTVGCRGAGVDRCVRFRDREPSEYKNPLYEEADGGGGDAVFEGFDGQGAQATTTRIVDWGGTSGLDCGFRLACELPEPASEVRLELAHFSNPATITAFDGRGRPVARETMQTGSAEVDRIRLVGRGIRRIEIDAPSDETVLYELCWTPTDREQRADGERENEPVRELVVASREHRELDREPDREREHEHERGEGCPIHAVALFGQGVVATADMHLAPGAVGTIELAADAITSVVIDPADAAVIDVCLVTVEADATSGWRRLPGSPAPIALPVRDPDYPAHASAANSTADRAEATNRVRYGNSSAMGGAPFTELRPRLVDLVDGGPAAGPMATRTSGPVAGVSTPPDPAGHPTMANQRPLDLVLLGALQPAIAQMVGLYWVDEGVGPGGRHDYLVVADHWGMGGGSSGGVLKEIRTNGFVNVDGWIVFDVEVAPSPPIAPPSDVRAYALPGLTTSAADGSLTDATNNAGVRWALPTSTSVMQAGSPVLYHVWRDSLGNALTPEAIDQLDPITKGAPVLPVATAVTGSGGGNWPPFAMFHIDRALTEGWYAYLVSGVDLFGRHSDPSAAADWWQWAPEPSPRPWYYATPASDTIVHAGAIRLLDKTPPPAPPGVEASLLDPADPLLVRDAAFTTWWASLSAAEQSSVLGLRVRWRWTSSQMRQAPDTAEFRVYVNPGSAPPSNHAQPGSWATRFLVVGFNEHVTVTTDAAGQPVRTYEVLLPLAGSSVRTGLTMPVSTAAPLAYANVGVTAVDDRAHTGDDPKWTGTRWGARTGNESNVGAPAVVYRVHRTPPDPPVVPADSDRVFATPADYHGKSYYTYRWPPAPNVKTHVFRALDDSVFMADWAHRVATGQRPALTSSSAVFPPASAEPRWDAVKRQQVADELNGLRTIAIESVMPAAARAAYASLSNDALRVLAGLPGVEKAFTQLTIRPLDPADAANANRAGPDSPAGFVVDPALRAFVDELDGASTNRYFYRSAYVDEVNNKSALSLASPPVWLPNVVPPRSPVVTKVVGGDRRVTITWASNREADLAEYRVYVASSPAEASSLATMTLVRTETVTAGDPAARPSSVSWTDNPVPGLVDRLYRVVAVDTAGNVSAPTAVFTARAVDESLPVPPAVAAAWTAAAPPAQARVSFTGADETLLEVRNQQVFLWQPQTAWLPPGAQTIDLDLDPSSAWVFRVRTRKSTGALSVGAPVTLAAL